MPSEFHLRSWQLISWRSAACAWLPFEGNSHRPEWMAGEESYPSLEAARQAGSEIHNLYPEDGLRLAIFEGPLPEEGLEFEALRFIEEFA